MKNPEGRPAKVLSGRRRRRDSNWEGKASPAPLLGPNHGRRPLRVKDPPRRTRLSGGDRVQDWNSGDLSFGLSPAATEPE